jgi:hypothetical protein
LGEQNIFLGDHEFVEFLGDRETVNFWCDREAVNPTKPGTMVL